MRPRVGLYAWFVFLVAILAIGVACSRAAADGDVTSEVKNKISADSGLQGKDLTVQTAGGVVTLSGTVDNEAQRAAASRYASSVSGVKGTRSRPSLASALLVVQRLPPRLPHRDRRRRCRIPLRRPRRQHPQ